MSQWNPILALNGGPKQGVCHSLILLVLTLFYRVSEGIHFCLFWFSVLNVAQHHTRNGDIDGTLGMRPVASASGIEFFKGESISGLRWMKV